MTQEMRHSDQDPLGLGDLPLLSPDKDGWDEIRAALEGQKEHKPLPRSRWPLALAAAALLVLTCSLVLINLQPSSSMGPTTTVVMQDAPAQPAADAAAGQETLQDLIALSQRLESRLKVLRDNTVGVPAQSALYMTELEDLIARVDGEIGVNPDSVDLWGQRVNLMLDLEALFRHQWEREYGRMAAL